MWDERDAAAAAREDANDRDSKSAGEGWGQTLIHKTVLTGRAEQVAIDKI